MIKKPVYLYCVAAWIICSTCVRSTGTGFVIFNSGFLLSAFSSDEGKADEPIHSTTYLRADSFMRHVLAPSGFNGGMLVSEKGRIVYESYCGKERTDRPDPMDSSSALHLASISKTFTGMAVLKLWEEGGIDLDRPVSEILEGFDFPGVTVKTLLNHRSGLPNYVHFLEQLGWDRKRTITNAELLRFMATHRKSIGVLKPDTRFNYSNTNYALLALVIERVSGMSYGQFLKERFFRPLGMNDSYVFGMEKADYAIPSYDAGYRLEPYTFLDAVYGDKNVYSTPRDLFKWDRALSDGSMFKASTLEMAYRGYSHEQRGNRNYGLGWRMFEPPGGGKIIYHNGWWHGNNTVFCRLIDDSATVIVLGNRYNERIYKARSVLSHLPGYRFLQSGGE